MIEVRVVDRLIRDLGLPPNASPARVIAESQRAHDKCRLTRSGLLRSGPVDLNTRRYLSAALLYIVMTDVANYERPNRELKVWLDFRNRIREAADRFRSTQYQAGADGLRG